MGKENERNFFTISFPNEFKEVLNSFGTTFGSSSNTTMNLVKVAKELYDKEQIKFFDILKKTQVN